VTDPYNTSRPLLFDTIEFVVSDAARKRVDK